LKFNEPFAWYLLNRYAWGSPDLIKNLLLSSKGFLKDFLKVFYNIKILLPSNIYAIFIVIFSLTLLKFKEKTHLFIITLIVFVITIIANFTQSPDLQSCLTRLFITNFPLFIFLARFLKNELAFSFILILFSIELLLFSLLFNFNIISISFPELIYIP
jgi:hypothetical protein